MSDMNELEAMGLLTTKEAAAYLGSTEGSLRSSRSTGHGPQFRKLGSAVLYRRTDLDEYLANLKPYVESRRRNRQDRAKKRGTLAD